MCEKLEHIKRHWLHDSVDVDALRFKALASYRQAGVGPSELHVNAAYN